MSRNLVPFYIVSQHLRRDSDYDDDHVQLLTAAASAAVLNYLGAGATFLDEEGNVPSDPEGEPLPDSVPWEVSAATLIVIGDLYRNRTGEQDGALDSTPQLPRAAVSLLYPLRKPVMA